MKKLLLASAIVASVSLTGCVTMQGEHAIVNGKCITCINNPMTGEAINYNPDTQPAQSQQSSRVNRDELAADGCRKPDGMYDRTHHFEDERWCDNVTLPGASFSDKITYSETVPVSVDMAYIKAKRLLRFIDPKDDDGYLNNNTKIDSIPGTYYGVNGFYGGPTLHLLWYADYDLQLEKVANGHTKVRLTYRTYSRDMDPKEFQNTLLAHIKGN